MARRHGHLLLNVHRTANRTQLSVRIDLGSLYRLILGVIVDHLSALIERLCCDFIVRIESLIYCHLANCVQHLGVVLVEPYLGGGVAWFELYRRRWSTDNILLFKVIIVIVLIIWNILAMCGSTWFVRQGASFERICLLLFAFLWIAVLWGRYLLVRVPGLSCYNLATLFLLQTLLSWWTFMTLDVLIQIRAFYR